MSKKNKNLIPKLKEDKVEIVSVNKSEKKEKVHKHIKMKKFNADKAKELFDNYTHVELKKLLSDIKHKAKKGKSTLSLNFNIRSENVEELKKRGFEVFFNENTPSTPIKISWE